MDRSRVRPHRLPHRFVPVLLSVALAGTLTVGLAACGSGEAGSTAAATSRPLEGAAAAGEEIVRERGCVACHSANGTDSVGPTWLGLAGSMVELEDGRTVLADDAYLARAILAPAVEVTKGAKVAMPSYEKLLSQDDVDKVVAYLRAIGAGSAAATAGG